jgi:hypothetical protein
VHSIARDVLLAGISAPAERLRKSIIMKPNHLTRILRITRLAAGVPALLIVLQFGTISIANEIVTIDRLVSHKSTVPAVAGKSVDLFVREKVSSAILNAPGGRAQPGKVALFVHGGFNPATLAFDVAYRDYSWMTFLARAGYDVFGMDMTGYGQSSRPMMDDPCNLNPRHQERLVPRSRSRAIRAIHSSWYRVTAKRRTSTGWWISSVRYAASTRLH